LLNCPIEVQASSMRTVTKPKYYCDLYWPDEQVDVEYDSDAYHTASTQIAKDAIRRNTLASAGVAVITVTRRQILSTEDMHKAAEALSKLLEKRMQYQMPEFNMQRAMLRRELLPKAPFDE
jgi:very-short-patch-repair endonuclease